MKSKGRGARNRWMNAAALSLLFVATALLVRLPYLGSGSLALDGDEAIVGLMARGGYVTAFVVFAQPCFALPPLPFLLFVAPRRVLGSLLLGLGLIVVPLAALGSRSVVLWEPQLLGPLSMRSVMELPTHRATALSGVFFYTEAGQPRPIGTSPSPQCLVTTSRTKPSR